MNIRLLLSPAQWPKLAALASLTALGVAHASESFGGLRPCALCLRQREVYWIALGIIVLGALCARLKPAWRFRRGMVALLGLAFVTGALVAGYHAGVEWHFWPGPGTCSGDAASLAGLQARDLGAALGHAANVPRCDQIPWSFAGLSMAGWNVLYSLALAFASFASLAQNPDREIAP